MVSVENDIHKVLWPSCCNHGQDVCGSSGCRWASHHSPPSPNMAWWGNSTIPLKIAGTTLSPDL